MRRSMPHCALQRILEKKSNSKSLVLGENKVRRRRGKCCGSEATLWVAWPNRPCFRRELYSLELNPYCTNPSFNFGNSSNLQSTGVVPGQRTDGQQALCPSLLPNWQRRKSLRKCGRIQTQKRKLRFYQISPLWKNSLNSLGHPCLLLLQCNTHFTLFLCAHSMHVCHTYSPLNPLLSECSLCTNTFGIVQTRIFGCSVLGRFGNNR